MSNRWIRFLLAVLAILVASAAAYRVVENEQRLADSITSARNAQFATETALSTVEDLKAALHAYVAPGQGLPFWSARAVLLLDKLRSSLLDVDRAVAAAGGSSGESLDVVDRLAAAEQRARNHMRSEQPLLAGEVIFNEVRDLLDGVRLQIVRGRDYITATADARETELKREQMMLVVAAVAVLTLVMLLLVPVGRRPVVENTAAPVSESPPVAEGRSSNVGALASLCGEIAAVTETNQIEPILDRTRDILGARGLIVWLSSSDRLELHAVATSGYDPRVIARLGPIHRETSNLTANAFRENTSRTSPAAGTTAAALAVPLPSPDGPAGVFAVELAAGTDVDDNKLAAARVIAAQLGSLLGSIPGAPAVATDAPIARSSS